MSRLSQSVRHLIRGKFLSEKKSIKETDNTFCIELAKSGFITRDNLLRNFIAGVQDSPIISNEHELTMSSYESTKCVFDSLLAQKDLQNITAGSWKELKSPFTFLRIPKSTSTEIVEICVTALETKLKTDASIQKDNDPVATKYNLSVGSSDKSEFGITPCIFYTILPLHSEKGKWTFAYQDLLRSRRKWWKRYFFNPSSIEVTETDARTEAPKASIAATFQGQNFDLSNNLTLENIRMLDKHEIPMVEVQYSGNSKSELLADNFKVVEMSCHISNGCVALMLDSVRKRLFLDSTRIALDRNLAPYKVATYCAEPSERSSTKDEKLEMTMLKSYLRQLLEKDNILVYDYTNDKENTDNLCQFSSPDEAGDSYGVPHQIIITPDSLKDGIVLIRDREVSIYYNDWLL